MAALDAGARHVMGRDVLLRAVVGLTLVPHGLRSAFGMFPSTGGQSHNMTEFVDELDRDGYRPAKC
jgi:hypothetical protein